MNTTTQNTAPTTKGGLGKKIIMLGVLPVIIMAILNIGVSFKTSGLFDHTLATLNGKAANTDKLLTASDKVNKSLVNVRNVFATLNAFHQKSILQRNQMAVKKAHELREAIVQTFTPLQQTISELGKTLNDTGMVSQKNEAGAVQAKRLRYMVRTATNLPLLFELYTESNERSLVFLGKRRADSAANNFIYEEASRQVVLQNTLDNMASVLDDLLQDVTKSATAQRNAFQDDVLDQLSSTKMLNFLVLGAVCLVLLAVSIWFASHKISTPLVNMVDAMEQLSQGDLEVSVPENQKDEIGSMASALLVFKESLIETKRMAEELDMERERIAAEQQEARNKLANEFESNVGEVVTTVATSSSQLQSTARNMNEIASSNQERAGNATQAATNATTNVHTVASAAEELSNSINEIARQVAESSTMASQAAAQAGTTNDTMKELAEAANKIGQVINLITDIAEQTNLLALNATIEAARAGEAGKGFAVVASEVKNLANQTASATDEIASHIKTIQATTDNAVEAIDEVSTMIDHMNEVSSAIAAAVEEQGAATQEIATNVESAAHSTQDASSDMEEVTRSAKRNGEVSMEVLSAAEGMSAQSDILRTEVDKFLEQVRAG